MTKYYADIFHNKSKTCVTIGEYSKEALEKSIRACIKQKGFKTKDCIWRTRTETI